jgi:pimeloyl-ACP methyl ester carboxylesterase
MRPSCRPDYNAVEATLGDGLQTCGNRKVKPVTIVLVPGFMLDADLWRNVEPGLSAFGPVLHADLSLDHSLAGMAERALSNVSGAFVLVGFSMGGYVAREMLRLSPERVSALILIATSSRGDTAIQARQKKSLTDDIAESFRGLSRSSIARSLHPDRAVDDELVARIQAMGRRVGGGAFLRQSRLERQDGRRQLADVRCPALVVAGERDRLRSQDEAAELRDGIPGATLAVIEGTGHLIPLEAPRCLLDVMTRWLTGNVLTT